MQSTGFPPEDVLHLLAMPFYSTFNGMNAFHDRSSYEKAPTFDCSSRRPCYCQCLCCCRHDLYCCRCRYWQIHDQYRCPRHQQYCRCCCCYRRGRRSCCHPTCYPDRPLRFRWFVLSRPLSPLPSPFRLLEWLSSLSLSSLSLSSSSSSSSFLLSLSSLLSSSSSSSR